VLALLVVCSAVAVTGPLAGTGAAVQTAGNTAVLTDGPNWYGQEFAVDVTGGTGGFTAQPGDTVYLLGVDEETDTVDNERTVLERLQSRVETVVRDTVDRLGTAGKLSIGEYRVFVSVDVLCQDCGGQYSVGALLDRGHCDCDSA